MNVSVLLVVLAVALLALLGLVVLLWPGLLLIARLLGVGACLCGIAALVQGSALLLLVAGGLLVGAALFGLIEPHQRVRRGVLS